MSHPAGHEPQTDWVAALEEAIRRRDAGVPVWALFDTRARTHHEADRFLPSRRVPGPEGDAAVARACARPVAGRRRVLYLHVPYCPAICTFCAFFRQPTGDADLDEYVDAVLGQIDRFGETAWAQSGEIDALYFGGGTPTVLKAGHFERLLSALRSVFSFSPEAEITVESRCHGTTKSYWSALAGAGVNRVSLGVQTFDTGIRRKVGRHSDRAGVLASIDRVRAAGIRCVSADLITNLPHQSPAHIQSDLETVERLQLDGASVYSLIPFPRSTLMKRIAEGREKPLGGVDVEYSFFQMASVFFAERPEWKRVSPVHFAFGTAERNIYNGVRAGGSDVLGFGAGAGSRLGSVSMMNHMSVEKFLESGRLGESGHAMVFETSALSPQQERLRAFSEALRFAVAPGEEELRPASGAVLESLEAAGLVAQRLGEWRVTEDGCFWAYNLASIMNSAICRDITTS